MSAPKLTEAQVRALRGLRDYGNEARGIVGRSAFGGLAITMCSLRRRGYVSVGDGYQITDAGRAALAAHEKGGSK